MCVSLFLFLLPSLPLSLSPSVPLSLCPSLPLSLPPSVPPSLPSSLPPSLSPSQLNRARAVEKEKDSLEAAKDDAEHYLSIKKEAAQKQYTLYERYKHDCYQLETKAREKETELAERVKEVELSGKGYREAKETKLKEQKKLYKWDAMYSVHVTHIIIACDVHVMCMCIRYV